MYKTILVPIDIEEDLLTEHALKHVEYLAKMSGAKVHFSCAAGCLGFCYCLFVRPQGV